MNYPVRPGEFILVYILYIIVSTYLSMITSSGWASIYPLVYMPTFIAISVVFLIVRMLLGKSPFNVPFHLLYLLLLIQFISLVFNTGDLGGDYGDIHYGSFIFIDRIASPFNIDISGIKPFLSLIGIIAGLMYLCLLIYILIKSSSKSKETPVQVQQNNTPPVSTIA